MNTPKQPVKALLSRGSKLFIATVLIATIASQVLNIKPASADSGSYPWYDAPCASSGSNLGKTTGIGYWCSGYNWGESPCPTGDGYCTSGWLMNGYYLLDQWGEGFRNCTGYAAWKLHTVFGINTSNWGNGADWNNSALAHGYSDDSSPQVGDIAQWNSPAPWGHVAYVYAVNNGIASYDEYNYGQDGNFLSSYTSASNSQGTPDHWIHIGTISTPPPPEVNYLLVRLGSVASEKAGLNTGWQTQYSNASDMQAAGKRMAFKDATTGHIWAIDYGTQNPTQYDEGTADQYVMTSSYLIERLGNVLQAKAGLNDNWTTLYSWATDVKAAGTRIAIIDTAGNLMAKDTLNGSWYTESIPTVSQYAVTPSFLVVRLGNIASEKYALSSSWQTVYSNASDMQAAGQRMAFKDANTGHIWAIDYGTQNPTLYDEGTADQYVVTSEYFINRLNNYLQGKAGLNDNWTYLYSWATDVKAAGQRIAIIDTGSNLMAKDTLTGAWYTESSPTIGQYVVTTTF